MAKITLKTPDPATYRGWGFVIFLGLVVAVLALIDRGELGGSTADDRPAGSSADCRLTVATDELNVRSAPDAGSELLATLTRGDVVEGTRTVRDGFRELADDRWAADQFLTPLPGTNCA